MITYDTRHLLLRREHFGFKHFLAKTLALVVFGIDEAHLNEIDFDQCEHWVLKCHGESSDSLRLR